MKLQRLVISFIVACILPCVSAQWQDRPDPVTPRTRDGKANLTAPAPRINGKPDLSGVWQSQRPTFAELSKGPGDDPLKVQVDRLDVSNYWASVFWGMKAADEPLTPAGAAVFKQHGKEHEPSAHCLPAGVPGSMLIYASKMIQTPKELIVMLETGDPARQIYLDGRSLPKDPETRWMGYSVGAWQGDTLTVRTAGFKEASWLDASGHPRSESMVITERFRRRDFGHIDLEVGFEDPKYYTRPFSFKTTLSLLPNTDILEYVCGENEKDLGHLSQH
jgi:hypothetical protein